MAGRRHPGRVRWPSWRRAAHAPRQAEAAREPLGQKQPRPAVLPRLRRLLQPRHRRHLEVPSDVAAQVLPAFRGSRSPGVVSLSFGTIRRIPFACDGERGCTLLAARNRIKSSGELYLGVLYWRIFPLKRVGRSRGNDLRRALSCIAVEFKSVG